MPFPYEPREYQNDMINAIGKCIENKKNLVMQASTGSGKTICALVPSVEYALKNGMRILYLTRTNSQQRQAIMELNAIGGDVTAIGFQGRSNMCILAEENPDFKRGNAGEISRLCSSRKKRTIDAIRKGGKMKNGCKFFANFFLMKKLPSEIEKKKIISAEEVLAYCRSRGICPYELNKKLAKKAKVIIAPYIYLFDPFLREKLAEWGFYSFDKSILIVDEAHNLPEYCRTILSPRLSVNALKMAIDEVKEYLKGEKEIINFCGTMSDLIYSMRERYINFSEGNSNDGLIPPGKIEAEVRKFGLKRSDIELFAERFIEYGEIIMDLKERKGKLPRSFLKNVGAFLSSWMELDGRWSKLIVDETRKNPRLEYYCLDASIAASIINSFHASIHMSGTLYPLEEYRDSLAIKDAELISFPSPFPKENKKIFYMNDISTRYQGLNDEMIYMLEKKIVDICNSFEKNTAVFFSSHAMLDRFLRRNICSSIKRNVYIERKGLKQKKLMEEIEKFKKKGGVLLSVIGGRISEGMDFPSEELEMVIIVGIPYPPPSAHQQALQKYYEKKFGSGWKYAVEAPTTRKLLQAIGRLIREKNDKGIAVILDERAVRFRKYVEMHKADDIIDEIKKFWGQ
ncbi:MAG: ATP-dependent DNA helicase [Candidatus Thermoplasmatota archaeon]|nr:ATP-dependent DNA helicase [Candidatus Thermoplasmatota archaeon]